MLSQSLLIQIVIVADLLMNFFFHIVQMRKFLWHQDAVKVLGSRFGRVESKLIDVDSRTRRLDESISARGETRPFIQECPAET